MQHRVIALKKLDKWPSRWPSFFEELMPAFVKEHYSPKESWKKKPFSRDDGIFFSKGIRGLSDIFTAEREKIPNYFQHERFRSAYLLYYFPLQCAKFYTIFSLYPTAIEKAVTQASKSGRLRIMDVGAGPGTASLAFLFFLTHQPQFADLLKNIKEIELLWFDRNQQIMNDGMRLIQKFWNLPIKITTTLSIKGLDQPLGMVNRDVNLVLFGNVFNEIPPSDIRKLQEAIERVGDGGMLIVEPATRKSAQGLISRLREAIIQQWGDRKPLPFWGPCLHAATCPLSTGRDWCHESIPAEIPGFWFKFHSRAISTERNWLKFTFLWIASPFTPAVSPHKGYERVISDPIEIPGNKLLRLFLICRGSTKGKALLPKMTKRGELLKKV